MSDENNLFVRLEIALKNAVRSGTIPNTEFILNFDGDDGSDAWSAMAGNPRPTAVMLQEIGGVVLTGIFPKAEEAIESLISKLS